MDADHRQAVVRQAVLEKRAAVIQMAEAMETACSDCRFALGNGYSNCSHPVFLDPRLDRISGRFTAQSRTTTMAARAPRGLCGPGGVLFEPRTLKQMAVARIKPLRRVAILLLGATALSLVSAGVVSRIVPGAKEALVEGGHLGGNGR